MKPDSTIDVYADLGIRPIINCQSQRTSLGGSLLSPEVELAMKEANSSYVIMPELMNKAGERVADLMGVEAAYITSGCAAALALSAAACMAGNDQEKRGRIPNTTGMKNEIVIQKAQRYGYDRSFTIAGAILVEAGEQDSCSIQQFEAALGSRTAAVAYLVEAEHGSSLPLEDVVEIAHSHGIPVIADAAAQIYPIDYFLETAQTADLVCFGGKFFGAPNSTGFVCGKKELVDAVVYDSQVSDVAFGRQPDGSPDWFFFATPTPDTANSTEGFQEKILTPAPVYALPGGFYRGSQAIQLSPSPGAVRSPPQRRRGASSVSL